jgi:hypothetical protein
MGRKLFVGNLPFSASESELEELFGQAGKVESVTIMRDMATGRARGFGFVEMATDEDAARAAAELNQAQLGGRALTVNEARPKPERSGGFGGPGGGGGRGRNGGGRGPLPHRTPTHVSDARADWLDVGSLHIGPVVLAVTLWSVPAQAQADHPNTVEQTVAFLVNSVRSAEGLSPLSLHADLAHAAREQALRMAETGRLFHSESARLQAVTPWWTRLAENVGMGPTVERIHTMFLASAPHAANMLGDFNCLGVGVEGHPDGTLFVALIFARIPPERFVQTSDTGTVSAAGLAEPRWSPAARQPLPR